MELSKQQDTYMDIQKRRTFIISFIYFGIIGVLCYIGLKKLLPILIPFMAAMAIAAVLEPAVSLLDRHMKGGKGRGRRGCAAGLLWFHSDNHVRVRQPNPVIHPGTGKKAAGHLQPDHRTRSVPFLFPVGKQFSPDTASTYQPLDKAWSVSWKMLLWASPPDCLGGALLP